MIRALTPELAAIAKNEINEDPKRTAEDLLNLKDWLSKQPHLKARSDDQWLIGILRGCKFSLERAKKKLDLYYTLKTTASDVTVGLKPTEPKFVEFLRQGTCLILPKSKSTLYPRVILIRAGVYDPNKNNVAEIMCIMYYLLQILLMEDDSATIVGVRTLVDYQGITMGHLSQANPSLLKKMAVLSQDATPFRLKGSHHFNMPPGVDVILTIVKGFLNEKVKQRIQILKTNEDLLTVIPVDVIPAEYGGTGGTISEIIEYWVNKLDEYQPWMEEEMHLGTDESKRPGNPLTEEDMFGLQGSFRKLDID